MVEAVVQEALGSQPPSPPSPSLIISLLLLVSLPALLLTAVAFPFLLFVLSPFVFFLSFVVVVVKKFLLCYRLSTDLFPIMLCDTISVAEVRSVQDGVANDTREDGRTLLQRRPVHLRTRATQTSTATSLDDDFHGSSVEVTVSETTVIAAASPSVVEVGGADGEDEAQRHPQPHSVSSTANEEEDDNGGSSRGTGRGQLFITIDAVPNVIDFYAHAIGGRGGRYRRDYLAYLASVIRVAFGAASVTVQEQQSQQQAGVAEAQLVGEGEEGEDDDNDGAVPATGTSGMEGGSSSSSSSGSSCGFPSKDLYIGKGFAFRIDVDVHILQAVGGNVLCCVAMAVHNALKAIRLPSVSLHESAAGVSVEVDRSKPYSRKVDWSQLPVLCVLLLSPTRHYLVDPTTREELALPQQLHVAANASGQLCYMRYQQLPSRRGSVYRLDGEQKGATASFSSSPAQERGGTAPVSRTSLTAAHMFPLNVLDWAAAVNDAVHVCQAMIADCEEVFRQAEGETA